MKGHLMHQWWSMNLLYEFKRKEILTILSIFGILNNF